MARPKIETTTCRSRSRSERSYYFKLSCPVDLAPFCVSYARLANICHGHCLFVLFLSTDTLKASVGDKDKLFSE